MTWIPALAVAGSVLALGPIIIHIIFRRRYQTVEFAAMRFLLDSLRRSRQRMRLEELLMIAMRVLICLLIGFMLADIRAESLLPGGRAPSATVFILDDSLSMQQRVGTGSLLDRAVDGIAAMIEQMDAADMVAVVSSTRPGEADPVGTFRRAGELRDEGIARRLRRWGATDLRSDLPTAIAAAGELLATQPDRLGELRLVSDFRRVDFDGSPGGPLGRAAAALEQDVELVLLDYGIAGRRNLTLEQIALGAPMAVAGVPTPLRITVRNNGQEPSQPVSLTVRIDESTLPAQMIEPLDAGEAAVVEVSYTFEEPGFAAVNVELPADPLPEDNRGVLAVEVHEAMRILIVDGGDNPMHRDSPSFALAHALDPSGDGAFGQAVDVVAAARWTAADLDRYDLVLLADVGELPLEVDEAGQTHCPAVTALSQYVDHGGGLGVFLGGRTRPDFFNRWLHGEGEGLLPVRIEDEPPVELDPRQFVRLRADSLADDPALSVFLDDGAPFVALVRFYGYVPVSVPRGGEGNPGTQVLASFDVDPPAPALVRGGFGRGRVMVWATSPEPAWSNWRRNPSFLAAMNDMAWELARQHPSAHDRVGAAIDYTLGAALRDATSLAMQTPAYPDEDIQLVEAARIEGQRQISFSPTPRAGLYHLRATMADQSERTVLFSRHFDPREGALAKADEAAIAATVGREHRYFGDLAVDDVMELAARPQRSYWWLLMAAVMLMLGLESVLARRFGHYERRAESARSRVNR